MSSAPTLDRLDAAHGGPFTYRLSGEVRPLPDPAAMSFEAVLTRLHLETFPLPDVPFHLSGALFRRWAAHYDLPDIASAQRLCFLVDRYADELDFDLRVHAQMDLGEMWRSRRWRTLLATIDRLPRHCYYSEAVSNDPDHVAALADAIEAREAEGGDSSSAPAAPPLRTWTPELATLTQIKDAVRRVEWAVVMAQHGSKAGGPPPFSPTPHDNLEAARKAAAYRRKLAKHQALTRRLLPHKRD